MLLSFTKTLSKYSFEKKPNRQNSEKKGHFKPFWQNFKVFGKTLVVYLIFDKMLNLLWQILYPIGQIFIHVNGQIFDKIIEPSCHTGNYRWPSCCLKKLFLWQFVILKF